MSRTFAEQSGYNVVCFCREDDCNPRMHLLSPDDLVVGAKPTSGPAQTAWWLGVVESGTAGGRAAARVAEIMMLAMLAVFVSV